MPEYSSLNTFSARVVLIALALLCLQVPSMAGNQVYEPMTASTRNALQRAVSDQAAEGNSFPSEMAERHWIAAMSERLNGKLLDVTGRHSFLRTVHYEATRAGLDPQLVLAVIQVESNFHKYAVSTSGARGYMQVMPFWIGLIGSEEHNLFHLRTNLRYGCLILRHYLDMERGNLTRALERYNGSLGQSWYPDLVQKAWTSAWRYTSPSVSSTAVADGASPKNN
jgi:soluble lytic murein transglycosylase-like protein